MFCLPWVPLALQQPVKVHPTLEVRQRFERRIDRDFRSDLPDGKGDLFTRVRVGAEFETGANWSGAVQLQLASDAVWTDPRNFSTQNRDASQAYVRYRSGGTAATIGRQKMAFGSERLLGNLEWANVARAYDGVRVTTKEWDAFAVKIGVSSPEVVDVRLAGVAYRWRAGETLLVFKHDEPAAGDVDVTTLAHRGAHQLGDWSLDYELALQGGETAGKDQRAWALHVGAAKPMGSKAKLFAEVNAASGGGDADTSRTFDNLYPTNHNKYGISDLQGWRNMNEFVVGASFVPAKDANVALSYHVFRLADAEDAWYGAGGAPNKRAGGTFVDPTGASGRDVGSEWNLDASIRLSPMWSVSAGLAVFEPGAFVRTLNGGRADSQTWGYVSLAGKF